MENEDFVAGVFEHFSCSVDAVGGVAKHAGDDDGLALLLRAWRGHRRPLGLAAGEVDFCFRPCRRWRLPRG